MAEKLASHVQRRDCGRFLAAVKMAGLHRDDHCDGLDMKNLDAQCLLLSLTRLSTGTGYDGSPRLV